jgi:transposase-like protein
MGGNMRTWVDLYDGCPNCKGTEVVLIETEVYGFEYVEGYECLGCGFKWDDVFTYSRSYESEERC